MKRALSQDYKLERLQHWVNDCEDCSAVEMATPPTPSVTSNETRQRSQSPTPYRVRNMADANIFVDHMPEPPPDVADQLKRVFGVASLEDIGKALHDTPSEMIAERYCRQSRQMARDCAGEGEWKSCLLSYLMDPIHELWPEIIKLSASKEPWIPELKPLPDSLEDLLRSSPPLPPTHTSHVSTVPPPPLPTNSPQTPPSNAPLSDTTPTNPNHVSTPNPDITLGLSHTSFSKLQRKILRTLQDTNQVLSSPHPSSLTLHFPFPLVQANSPKSRSNLTASQNQAAVAGACALTILCRLDLTVLPMHQIPPPPRRILFSIATQGPVHELWVHFQVGDAYHMTLLRIWRTTFLKEARELVRAVVEVLGWGVSGFRDAVLGELGIVENGLRERRCSCSS